ncbi:MAG: hypothetical protein WD960_16075 [Gemmatimonadota bacterium]
MPSLRSPTLPGSVSPAHWLSFAVLWAVAMALVAVIRYPETLVGGQLDSDGYMRLVRIEELVQGWSWFETRIFRSNFPFSDVLHWTRPLDALILLLAAPLALFLSGSTAILVAGTLVSPLLTLASCLALIWAAAPVVSRDVRALAAPALLIQPVFFTYGLAGRADHHALIGFLFVVATGLVIRWSADLSRGRDALATGLVCALGIWVSPEFLLPLALALLVGGWLWIRQGPAGLGVNLALTGGLLLGLAIALLLERPPSEWLTVEYDRVSVAHFTVAVLALGFWLAVSAFATGPARLDSGDAQSGGPGRRTLGVLAGGAVTGLLLHLVHRDFFRGPWVSADPEVQRIWLQHVQELRPMAPTSLDGLGEAIAVLGLAPFLLAFFVFRARRERPGAPWVFLAVSCLLFFALTLAQARWGLYLGSILALGVVALLDHLLPLLDRRSEGLRRRFLRLGLFALLIPGPVLLGYALAGVLGETTEVEAADASPTEELIGDAEVEDGESQCRLRRLAPLLRDPAVAGNRKVTVLAHVDRGAEILYRTPHRVLAGPYHRNLRGIEDIHRSFTLPPDDPVVLGILKERAIRLVLLCPDEDEAFLGRGGEGSTFHRLVDGPVPDWAAEIPLSEELLGGGFRLFRVEVPG